MSDRDRGGARLRAAAAVVLAATGGAVAWMAPDAFTDTSPDAAAWWLRGCAVGGVAAAVLVVVANLTRALAVARLAFALGWACLIAIVLGGLFLAVDDLPVQDAVGLGFIVAIPAAGAIILALMTMSASD